MNDLTIFENEQFGKIRLTVGEDGEPWFVGQDVAQALGYSNTRDALAKHVDQEDKNTVAIRDGIAGNPNMTIINESGLYSLTLSSKLPTAKEFKRWVTHEVLPSIRRTGGYVANEEQFLDTYLPGVEEPVRQLFRVTLTAMRQMGENLKQTQLALLESENNVHLLDLDNRRLRPKADYFDALVEKNLLTSLRETAKLFHVKERKLVKFLVDNRFLYRTGSGTLLPYATRPANQLFEVKEARNEKTGWFGLQTLVTPRGRETFRLLLKGKPESELWGQPTVELPPEMTAADAERTEAYYRERAAQK